ncbi:LPD7 domain-containing protein, partial [Erwinia amylovora]
FATMSKEMEESLGERSIREKVRIITAADLYTRKASLSDNIHYLDKKTDKTLFIDTGKAIAVSKNGMSESGVAVALELAKEKFGSTLTVKGTEAFKNTAIEVVAQKGLDIHFTDKEMNRRLAERKQELALEREG